MVSFGLILSFVVYLIGALAFTKSSRNLIQVIVSLELMLLSIGLFLVNLSFYLDDLIGATLALYLLPLAGAESAIALALLVAFYPTRLNLNLYHYFIILSFAMLFIISLFIILIAAAKLAHFIDLYYRYFGSIL